jgi:Glycosyl hydrolase family 47
LFFCRIDFIFIFFPSFIYPFSNSYPPSIYLIPLPFSNLPHVVPSSPYQVESAYHLFKATKNAKYLEFGRKFLFTLQNVSRASCGYASIADVSTHRLGITLISCYYFFACFFSHIFVLSVLLLWFPFLSPFALSLLFPLCKLLYIFLFIFLFFLLLWFSLLLPSYLISFLSSCCPKMIAWTVFFWQKQSSIYSYFLRR